MLYHLIVFITYCQLSLLSFQQMMYAMLSTLVLIAAAISATHGQNNTVSPTAGNSTSVANLTTTPSVLITQETTDLATNVTQQTNATPGIKKGECYGFEVFVLNNQLNIPYTVTCCIAVLCGFYLVLFGKNDCFQYCKLLYISSNIDTHPHMGGHLKFQGGCGFGWVLKKLKSLKGII